MALIAATAKSELPNPVAIINPVDDPRLSKAIQSPVDGDPV